MKLSYDDSGVKYQSIDPFKKLAQRAAKETKNNITRLNFSEFNMSRGESAYLIETDDCYLAHVEEGLGTKNLVADEMFRLTGIDYYDSIAQDTVAMIVNDMITCGALPLSVAMHVATGSSDWFSNELRTSNLIDGWKTACNMSGCTWGCGESPVLNNIIHDNVAMLSGSAIGIIQPKSRIIYDNIQDGDYIVLLESSGIHANGLTLARKIASKLPDSYLTKLSNNSTYGESLLTPTLLYVNLIETCLKFGIQIHYAVNITGHGWRKLMRSPQPFKYTIDVLPERHTIFDFIQHTSNIDEIEMFSTFNMGAGFALYADRNNAETIVAIASSCNIKAIIAGEVTKSTERSIEIIPNKIQFKESDLDIR